MAVSLDAASEKTITVDFTVGGSSTAPVAVDQDHNRGPGTLTFLPGETSKNIPVGIVDDAIDELNETVTLALTNQTNSDLGSTPNHIMTITDNDGAPNVAFDTTTSSYDEG